ncbi:MAG: hypothetical protein IT288_01480 [Bdellovibrionales bacterium]|nr:hypothetical protein [Bdellovibrionales bacterium]
MTNRILSYFVLTLVAFFTLMAHAPQALAFKSGQVTCFWEVVAKDTFPAVEKLAPFTFDLTEPFTDAFQATHLKNRLLVAYYPGLAGPGDVNQLIVNLKYDGANAGADVPALADGTYTFKISRDDSDLVGAFLNCHSTAK